MNGNTSTDNSPLQNEIKLNGLHYACIGGDGKKIIGSIPPLMNADDTDLTQDFNQ